LLKFSTLLDKKYLASSKKKRKRKSKKVVRFCE